MIINAFNRIGADHEAPRRIDGKKIAGEILRKLKALPVPQKFLAAVLVDSASPPRAGSGASFLKQKEKTAEELGVDFRLYKLPFDSKNDRLRDEVGKISSHKTCGGVIVQLPLPEGVGAQYVLNAIPREKDVDVLGERALGAFYAGRSIVLPPAVGAALEALKSAGIEDFKDKKIAVVGRGALVGKPIASWFTGKVKEIFVLGRDSDLSVLKEADIVISGVGKAGLVKPDILKPGAGVIDFGYSVVDGKIRGDFDAERLATGNAPLAFYTPTPGGTGPILVAKLLENFYKLNLSRE